MKHTEINWVDGRKRNGVAFLLLVLGMLAVPAPAQSPGQKTFKSTQSAVDALIAAARSEGDSELQAILGPGSEEIISSGDAVADKAARERFIQSYEAKHYFVESAPHQLTLNVGKNDWPLPIPLVHGSDELYFDGAAGKEEILYRRIGHNELAAIKVCNGVVATQRDYVASGHDGQPAGAYAQRLLSEPGKHNGLYWAVPEGEEPSPAGPLLARASAEGYDTSGQRTPYHSYYYRLMTAQGSSAKGGAKSYIVDGRMTGGFALVAYPAAYRSSGVMTFIVNQRGQVYESHLGESTAELAAQMTDYNPDKTWKPVK